MLVPMLDEIAAEIVLYALLSLALMRMLPVSLALLGSDARRPIVAFLGWFGPRGLARSFFAVILVEDAQLAHGSMLLNTIFLTIALSVLLPSRPVDRRPGGRTRKHRRVGSQARLRGPAAMTAQEQTLKAIVGAVRLSSRHRTLFGG